jgi:hypothetical protein
MLIAGMSDGIATSMMRLRHGFAVDRKLPRTNSSGTCVVGTADRTSARGSHTVSHKELVVRMDFFVLDYPPKIDSLSRTDFLPIGPENLAPAPACDECGEPMGSLVWLPPYHVELKTYGADFGDLVFGPGDDLLVSDRLRAAFVDEGLKGLNRFEPVEVADVDADRQLRQPPPRYFHSRVELSGALLDDESSGVEREGPAKCGRCGLDDLIRAERVILEEDTWTGEDIFIARGLPGTYLASARFREMCVRHAFKNAVFIPAKRYGFDLEPWTQNAG